MPRAVFPAGLLIAALCVHACECAAADGEKPLTGPQTEGRFPPLHVPAGFQVTLFACDPLVEYPSVIALGPRPRTLFVAHDYLTGLGTEIVRRDEVRLVEDTDGDGYADNSTFFADGFNSIQGLAYYDGAVFVMHAPFLTSLRDTDGDGSADERHDLLSGLGLPPEDNPPRLHCANGVTAGHDNWLYLSLGDHGCDVTRPEGDRLVHHGGAILRCRPDGTQLHLFATGLRNIYDVALDEELNVFVRDNENDGGDYMIRVYHSFFGADHGYPYNYYERPDLAMPPLADLGRGSSAGGACYLETAFPPEYRSSLFFCEWGRSVVNYRRERAGSSFAPMKEMEFAAGAEADPYGFKPTDVIVDRDGSLIVSDWADGQRPRRGRGRIYRIAYPQGAASAPVPPESGSRPSSEKADEARAPSRTPASAVHDLLGQLNSPRYHQRASAQLAIGRLGRDAIQPIMRSIRAKQPGVLGRLHLVWILADSRDPKALDLLFEIAESDGDPRIRAQAIRALADLYDPVLVQGKLAAGPAEPGVAERFAALATDHEPRVLLEVVIALGRLQWTESPEWLLRNVAKPDTAIAHAAIRTLRRSGNWSSILKLLDEPDDSPMRSLAVRAVSDQFHPLVVDGLMARLRMDAAPRHRREYADLLTRVCKKPGPWKYWGYRAPPRPANALAWEKTEAIETALDRVLADADVSVRMATLERMDREQIAIRPATLGRCLAEERNPDRVARILDSLSRQPADQSRDILDSVVRDAGYAERNRLLSLELYAKGLKQLDESGLLALASSLEDGPVLAETLSLLGSRPGIQSADVLLAKCASSVPGVRAAAVESLARLEVSKAESKVLELLEDKDRGVRRAAAWAAGQMNISKAGPALLPLAHDGEPAVRSAALESLAQLNEPGAVPDAVAALENRETQLSALAYVGRLAGAEQADAVANVARNFRSTETVIKVIEVLAGWEKDVLDNASLEEKLRRLAASVQGESGLLVEWTSRGPIKADEAARLAEEIAQSDTNASSELEWHLRQTMLAAGEDAGIQLSPAEKSTGGPAWVLATHVIVAERTDVQFLGSVNGTFAVWLNGGRLYASPSPGPYRPDAERFSAVLAPGENRLVVSVNAKGRGLRFHLRFRRRSSSAKREQLAQFALTRPGDTSRGRAVFTNVDKSLCLKCHHLGTEGGQIGPELTGVGSRFSRVYLIESILEPSRAVAQNYETLVVSLADGRVLSGVKTGETETTLSLGDKDGKTQTVPKSEIEERKTQSQSIMPDGLEERLSEQEFVDLIAFLRSQSTGR